MGSDKLAIAAIGLLALFSASSAGQATTLEEAINSAIIFHPQIKRDEALERAAEQTIDEAYSGYLPSLDVDVSAGAEVTDSPVTRAAGRDTRTLFRREVNPRSSQMLFDGMATPRQVAASRANHRAATDELRDTSEFIAVNAAQLFLNVLRDQELVAIAEENVRRHVEITDQIRGLAAAGRGSEADIAQAESRLALARSTLEERRGSLRTAVARYTETVGRPPEDLKLPQVPNYGEPVTVEEAIAVALVENPAISASAARVDQQREEVGVARAEYYPRVDAEVFAGIRKDTDGTVGRDNDFNARLRTQWNLFDGFGKDARVRRAKQLVNAAEGNLDDESRRVREETRVVFDRLVTERDRLIPLREHVVAAERVRIAYQGQFDVGRRSLLDLLDAQGELFLAETQLADGEFSELVSQYDLLFTMGLLLPTLGIVVSSEVNTYD